MLCILHTCLVYFREREESGKNVTPEKAAQIERLGMGVTKTSRGGVSHSALGDMQVIEQVTDF